MNVGILGSGSWATAIAKMLCTNVDTLHWWVRSEETATELQQYGHNPRHSQSISLPTAKLPVTTDMQVGNVGAMPPFHEDLDMLAAAAIAPSACASTQTRNLAFKSGREVCPFCGSSRL